jgi:hypothetical protein
MASLFSWGALTLAVLLPRHDAGERLVTASSALRSPNREGGV